MNNTTNEEKRTITSDQTRLGRKLVAVLFFGLFLILSPFLPTPSGMHEEGLITLAILFFAISLWFTAIIPAAVASLAIIVLFPLFGVLTFEEATRGLGKEVIYLIIAVLIMGAAVEKSGLHKRLAYNILLLAKGNTRLIIFSLIAVAFVLTFFIPNGLGRLSVVLPIANGLISVMREESGENIEKALMLAISCAPWVCVAMVMTASSGALYAASLFETVLGFSWSYLHWMIVMLPGSILALCCLWLIIIWLYPPLSKSSIKGQAYSQAEKKKLGSISASEKKIILFYLILITLWLTKEVHHLSIAMSAVIVVIFLFAPGIQLIGWQEAKREVDWGVPLIFAAGFTLAYAFEQSGVVLWLAQQGTIFLNDLPISLLALSLMLIFGIIRLGFINFAAMIASLMPVALTFAKNTAYNPVWLGMICVVASGLCFLFPSQSIGNMTIFSLGYYTSQDMLKVGGLLTVSIIVITLLLAFLYWPLVGLPILEP